MLKSLLYKHKSDSDLIYIAKLINTHLDKNIEHMLTNFNFTQHYFVLR